MNLKGSPPDIYIDSVAMAKLRSWTAHAAGEVSGLGLVEVTQEDGVITDLEVTEVFILKQECTSASTELDSEAIAQLLVQLEEEGKANQLRVWWHSHGALGVFWSGTDEDNIERLRTGDFLLSLVVNKHWDVLARLDLFSPVPMTFDDIPVHIMLHEQVHETCRQEVQELVNDRVMTTLFPTRRLGPPAVDRFMADPFAWCDGAPYLEEEP